MAYSYARDFGNNGPSDNTVPYQSTDRLRVTRNTTGPVFLSGSRIEATSGYVELNALNTYDKANHYSPNKPTSPTKTSSISHNGNPYGWFDPELVATRRTPVSEVRDEVDSARHTERINHNMDQEGELNTAFYTRDGFSDIGRTRQTQRESHFNSDNERIDRGEPYTSRESSLMRQTVQDPTEINLRTTVPPMHAQTELGRTQLRQTMLRETMVQDDEDVNPIGHRALGPTRRPPTRDSIQQGVSMGNDNETDHIYASRINAESKTPPTTNQFSKYNFGDTLKPPKKQLTGANLGQTMTYDYPYIRQVTRSSEMNPNDSSQNWIEMATDQTSMRWLHIMFAKFRSKWRKGENETEQPREAYIHQRVSRKRRRHVSLYTCTERVCIGVIVSAMLVLATLLPVFIITGYKQDAPKLRMYTLECTLLNFTYVDTLEDPASSEFINISQSFCNKIDANDNATSIDIGYEGCIVEQISNGSAGVQIAFSVFLRPYNIIPEDDILTPLGLVPENSVIALGNFLLSSDINRQPWNFIEDKNNPLNKGR